MTRHAPSPDRRSTVRIAPAALASVAAYNAQASVSSRIARARSAVSGGTGAAANVLIQSARRRTSVSERWRVLSSIAILQPARELDGDGGRLQPSNILIRTYPLTLQENAPCAKSRA